MSEELDHARKRLSIFDALVQALEQPHELLDIFLDAQSPEVAADRLQQRFGFDPVQAMAVIDLQLRRVTADDHARIVQSRHESADIVRSLGGASEK